MGGIEQANNIEAESDKIPNNHYNCIDEYLNDPLPIGVINLPDVTSNKDATLNLAENSAVDLDFNNSISEVKQISSEKKTSKRPKKEPKPKKQKIENEQNSSTVKQSDAQNN